MRQWVTSLRCSVLRHAHHQVIRAGPPEKDPNLSGGLDMSRGYTGRLSLMRWGLSLNQVFQLLQAQSEQM